MVTALVAVLCGPLGTAAADVTRAAAGAPAGTVVAWGDDRFGQLRPGQLDVPAGLDDVVSVSAGSYHALALRTDGTVVAWGLDNYGQATVPASLSDVVAVAAGDYHSLALRADGTVVEWGDDPYYDGGVPPGLSGVVAIDAGSLHNLALRSDGTVVEWGHLQADPGWTRMPPGLSGVVAIAAGSSHSLAVTADGSVVAWGWTGYGQTRVPPGLADVVAVSGEAFSSHALTADGRVVGWGNDPWRDQVPAGLTDVVSLVGGGDYAAVLRSDGTVVAWGVGILADPAVPAGLRGVVAVDVNQSYGLAVVGPAAPRPGTPTGVTATAAPGAAVLSWTPPARGGLRSFYRVTAAPTPGGATVVGFAPPASTGIRLLGLTPGATYAISVVAVNGGGRSSPSVPVTVTPTRTTTPFRITGVPETGPVAAWGDEFATPLTGRVVDRAGDGVPDVDVILRVAAGPAAFSGQASVTVTTDADGVYTAPVLTAGQVPGPVAVTATVATGRGSATHLAVVRQRGPAGSADLRVALSSVGSASVGQVVPISVRVRNTGSAAASGTTVAMALPPGLAVTDAGGGTVTTGGARTVLTHAFADLEPGASAVVVVRVKVGATTVGPARLRAVVGSATSERMYGNNVAVTVPLAVTG